MTLKVLVADDHLVNRLMLQTLFENLGCSVVTVTNGRDALDLDQAFDLICVDRHMPLMGGEELAGRLGPDAFVVACTSHPADLAGAFKMVIEKPIDSHAIAAVVVAARTWRLTKCLASLSAVEILRERHRICALARAHPQVGASMTEAVHMAAVAAARTWRVGASQGRPL